MKQITNFTAIILIIIIAGSCNTKEVKTQSEPLIKPKVSIVFPVTVDAFNDLELGLTEICANQFDIQSFSAEGDADKFETVIKSALIRKPDYLITVGTQITNTAFGPQFKKDLPVVIAAAISSPELVEALVAVGLEPPRKFQVAIISDSPQENIYELFSKTLSAFLPNTKKVGIIYNLGEVNSKGTSNKTVVELKKTGIQVIDGIINKGEDIEKVTEKLLLEGSEAIIIPHDKNAVTKASSIVKKCDEKNIPVFSLDDGTVKKDGVSIGVSVNYKTIGNLIGEALLKINSKEMSASNMPIVSVKSAKIYVNTKKITALGIKQPENLRLLIEQIK